MVAALMAGLISVGCGAAEGGGASDQVRDGAVLYERNCAVCHGQDLGGTAQGPPFLSPIYAPDHHSDDSFRRAVRQGVQPHHWQFGPMPPVAGLEPDGVDAIIAHIRSVQEREGG